jgi:hypothetical protein
MNAPDDEYPTVIDAVIRALLSEGRERGAELIETIRFPREQSRSVPLSPVRSRDGSSGATASRAATAAAK